MRQGLPALGSLLLLTLAGLAAVALNKTLTTRPVSGPVSAPFEAGDEDIDGVSAPSLPLRRPAGYFDEILERPLLAPTRRPVPLAEPEPEPEPELVDEAESEVPFVEADLSPLEPSEDAADIVTELRLHGVMISTKGAEALVSSPGMDLEWKKQGEEFAGWRIETITDGWIELRQASQTIRVNLYEPR